MSLEDLHELSKHFRSIEQEKLLSISSSKVDLEEVKEGFRQEVEQQTRQMQTIINGLVAENMDLKKQLQI